MFDFKNRNISKDQLLQYIAEALPDLPDDILQLIYRIIACHESGLE